MVTKKNLVSQQIQYDVSTNEMVSNVSVNQDSMERIAKRTSTNVEELFVRMVEHARIRSMHSNVNAEEDLKV